MRMRVHVAWGLVAVLLTVTATADPVNVVNVKTIGPAKADDSYVRAYISVEPGQEFNAERVSSDVRALLKTGRFTDVRVERVAGATGYELTYIVQGKLRLADTIRVRGARRLKHKKILSLLELDRGDWVDDATLAVRGRAVTDEYREKGYLDATLTWSLDPVPGRADEAIARLRIREGIRTRVTRLDFEGNTAITSRSLRRTTSDWRWYNPFSWFTRKKGDAEHIAEYSERAEGVYMAEGYLDVAVAPAGQYEHRQGKQTLEYRVEEGPRYRLGDVWLKGITLFPEADLFELIPMAEGDPITPAGLFAATEAVRTYYTSRGYRRTTVKRQLNAREQQQGSDIVADLVITVSEGSLMHVRNIFIRGNNLTREEVIRRELAIYPGDEFDERRIKRSEARLRNLGYFSLVTSHDEPTPRLEDSDLVFTVEEQRTGTFMIGGGFSSIDNLVGFIDLTEGNFDFRSWPPKGAGQKLKLRAQFGSRTTSSEISFVEPWWLGRRLSLSLDLFARETDYSDYDVSRSGGSIGLARPISNRLFNRVDLKYGLESVKISDVTDTNEYTRLMGDLEGDPYYFTYTNELKSQLSLGFTRETRDSYFAPTRGNRVVLSGRISGGLLGGDSQIYGWRLKAEQYYPAFFDHVIALKGRFEVTDAYGDGTLQLADKLFVGGGRTIRGFDYRGVGPKVGRDTNNDGTNDIVRVIGGKSLIVGTAEYVVPLFEKLSLAGFVDTGNVWEDAYEFIPDNMASSIGLELRFDIPQFPVRISYAWPLDKEHEDTEVERLGFWIGSGF